MRILVATDQWSPDVVGGSARVAADTARALARRGHEVVAVAPAVVDGERVALEEGVEVHRVVRRRSVPQSFADPLLTRRYARRLGIEGFDVALTHQATNGAGLAGLDVPQVAVFHASAVLEMRFLRDRARGVRRLSALALEPALAGLERRWLHAARAHLVLSQYSAGLLQQRQPALTDRVRVVGGGVDESFFEAPSEPGATLRARLGVPNGPLLFTARRLEPRMGVELLVEAMTRLSDRRVVLAVAGDGTRRGAIEEQVSRHGLRDRVVLLGRIGERELHGLYAESDVFVLPTVAYEGFGMSTVEALAQGTIVVGTDAGATPEILRELDPQLVVPRGDADALAAGIEHAIRSAGPASRARTREFARARYHWDRVIERWESVLGQPGVVDGPTPADTLRRNACG